VAEEQEIDEEMSPEDQLELQRMIEESELSHKREDVQME